MSAGAAYLALSSISPAALASSLGGAAWGWVAPALALSVASTAIRALRWPLLFADPRQVPFGASFAAISIGVMFSAVLPWRAGEVPRALALRRAVPVSTFEIATTIVVERLLDVFVLALGGLVLWPLLPDQGWIDVLAGICAAVVFAFAVVLALAALLRERWPVALEWLLRRLPLVSDERARRTRAAVEAGSRILVDRRRLVRALGLTVGVWVAIALCALALEPALAIPGGVLGAGLVTVAGTFSIVIPAGPASIGVFEAAAQASVVALGADPSAGLSFALVLHAVLLVPSIVLGLVSTWWIGRGPARVHV